MSNKDRYTLKSSQCNCHPETCGHWDYRVYDNHKHEDVVKYISEDEGAQLVNELNSKAQP